MTETKNNQESSNGHSWLEKCKKRSQIHKFSKPFDYKINIHFHHGIIFVDLD